MRWSFPPSRRLVSARVRPSGLQFTNGLHERDRLCLSELHGSGPYKVVVVVVVGGGGVRKCFFSFLIFLRKKHFRIALRKKAHHHHHAHRQSCLSSACWRFSSFLQTRTEQPVKVLPLTCQQHSNTMRRVAFFVVLLSLVVRAVCSTAQAEADLHRLAAVLVEQNTQLTEVVDGLRVDLFQLQQKHAGLFASTTAQSHEDARWRREATAKLQSLVGGRRLATAVSTQRRGLSSDTCADKTGPRLLVEGVCSCTGALLVEGRNVTKELDQLKGSGDLRPTTATTTAIPTAIVERNCSVLDQPAVVGSIIGDGTSMNSTSDVALSRDGNYAYVLGSPDSITVVDVSDPTGPTVVGSITGVGGARSVAISPDGFYAYVVGGSSSIAVVDVSDPSTPTLLGNISGDSANMDGPYGVAASPGGNYAYVVSYYSDSFAVVDVSDPSRPTVVGSIIGATTYMDGPIGVAMSPGGNYTFVVAVESDSIAVVDVSDPSSPTVVGSIIGDKTTMHGAYGVAVSHDGSHAYVVSLYSFSIAVVDVSDVSHPTVVGSITGDITNMYNARNVAVSPDGKYAYVSASESDSIAVVDVTDPSGPTVVASIVGDSSNLNFAYGLAVSPDGNFVYVTARKSDRVAVVQWQNCTTNPITSNA